MQDHSTTTLEPEQVEQFALQRINQAAAIFISSEAKEFFFESNYATEVQPAFLFFVLLYDEPLCLWTWNSINKNVKK